MPTEDVDSITLHAMRFHTLVGVLPHEREHPQPLEIDLTLWTQPGAKVVDYRRAYAAVSAVVEGSALFYLEELAQAIAARVLTDDPVQRVRVTVRKPHAAVGGPLAFAQVSIVRHRNA